MINGQQNVKSHFHIFKTVFLSLFGLKNNIFRFITVKKFWDLWSDCHTGISVIFFKFELEKVCTHYSTNMLAILLSSGVTAALFGPMDAAVLWYFDTVYNISKWLVLDPLMGLTSEVDHSHHRYFVIPTNSTDQSPS
jgi:hypothetical protein